METESCDTIADGLATRTPVQTNVESIRQLVDNVVLVSERELLLAVDTLLLEEHVLAETGRCGLYCCFAEVREPADQR